jgi:diaminohydroxyphosphoribosylaminopyrimidine deaminase/5-amino-6-(5-phosphoribosylamino)uracil reductase
MPGVTVSVVPGAAGEGLPAKTDLAWVLQDLALRRINELHLEAGERLLGSFLRGGWVDEVLLYQAPVLLGPGRGVARWASAPLESLEQGLRLQPLEWAPVGGDLRLRALTEAGQRFWSA